MNDLDLLIHRYLEDRSSLTADELDNLVAHLRADDDLASRLHDQLLLDDLLAQKLTLDRRNFVAQVEQRIADLARGPTALSAQVADLSSLAAAEKPVSPLSANLFLASRYALAVVVLLGLAVSVLSLSSLSPRHPVIAKVTEVSGDVSIGDESDATKAEVDSAVESGQRLVVPRGAQVSVRYDDGTEIRVKGDPLGDSLVIFGTEEPGKSKEIRIERGEVVATVKPQPLRFVTPHAVATAPASTPSTLRLVVAEDSTLLDVSEGKVRFDRLFDKRPLDITANESGLASRDKLELKNLTWPDRRDGLSFLLSPLEAAKNDNKPLTMERSPETRRLRPAALETRGEATLLESRLFYELNGGYLFSSAAGPAISNVSSGGSELTLEAIFCPASLDQAGPARILALSDESDDPDFALGQDGPEVTFCMRTEAKQPATPSRVPIQSADTPVHVTVTYRNGELSVYQDGMLIARSKDLWGSLRGWRSGPLTAGADASGNNPWRGILEAFALYNRCLEPSEVVRNVRNYKLLAGRGM
jgi:hypothetical protein